MRGIVLWTALAVAMSVLIACSGEEQASESGQVIARVNDEEITVHQLNFELARLQAAGKAQDDSVGLVTKRIIEQYLFVQQAKETGLDRKPDVLLALESAKRQVLAQAYLDLMLANIETAQDDKIVEYYHEHPELFSKRRIYQLNEALILKGISATEVDKKIKESSFRELVEWLGKKNIPVQVNASIKPAEVIQPEILQELNGLKQGEALVLDLPGDRISVLYIREVREKGLSLDDAKPLARYLLKIRMRKEAIEREVERLRAISDINILTTPVSIPEPAQGNEVTTLRQDPSVQMVQAGQDEYAERLAKGLK